MKLFLHFAYNTIVKNITIKAFVMRKRGEKERKRAERREKRGDRREGEKEGKRERER
jgi:hypothetical protein